MRGLGVVAWRGPGGPRGGWGGVLVGGGEKLGVGSAGPRGSSGWRGHLGGRLVGQAQPSVEENRL